jgi:hypothetical protein
MSAGAFTPVLVNSEASEKHFRVIGTITVTAGDYSAAGLTLDFSALNVPSQASPFICNVASRRAAGSGATALYLYNFNRGTTQANGKLQVFTGAAAQSGLAELADGALPAGVTGDVIVFEAWFLRL